MATWEGAMGVSSLEGCHRHLGKREVCKNQET